MGKPITTSLQPDLLRHAPYDTRLDTADALGWCKTVSETGFTYLLGCRNSFPTTSLPSAVSPKTHYLSSGWSSGGVPSLEPPFAWMRSASESSRLALSSRPNWP